MPSAKKFSPSASSRLKIKEIEKRLYNIISENQSKKHSQSVRKSKRSKSACTDSVKDKGKSLPPVPEAYTDDDFVKIYDLRASYGKVTETLSDQVCGKSDHVYAVCKKSSKGDNLKKARSGSYTVNISPKRRSRNAFSSLRVPSGNSKGARNTKKESSDRNPTKDGHRGRAAGTYIDPSFVRSDVSFHVQGSKDGRKQHRILASPSNVTLDEPKGKPRRRLEDCGGSVRIPTIVEENEYCEISEVASDTSLSSRSEGNEANDGRSG